MKPLKIEEQNAKQFNRPNEFGWTILHEAVVNNDFMTVQKLLKLGVDPDIPDTFTSANVLSKHTNFSTKEIQKIRNAKFEPIVNDLNPNITLNGCTALHYAVLLDYPEIVQLLLKNGANPNLTDYYGHAAEQYIDLDTPHSDILVKEFVAAKANFESNKIEYLKKRAQMYPLEERLHKNLIGQDMAISECAGALRRKENGWLPDDSPLVMLFLGSSGVGKTALAKQIAKNIVSAPHFSRFDMSEFQHKHEVSKFIGAPPGYVGYDQGGALTETLKKHPDSVILLDEIEKAHPDVLTVLLQLFDDGRITDGQGNTVNCPDAVFVMTSNLASENIAEYAIDLRRQTEISRKFENISESSDKKDQILISRSFREKIVKPKLKSAFKRDEFIGRINEIVYFLPFSHHELRELTILEMSNWQKRAELKHGISLEWSNDVITVLANAYDVSYGARSIQHEVERRIINKLAMAFETGKLKKGDNVVFKIGESLNGKDVEDDLSNIPIVLFVNDSQI